MKNGEFFSNSTNPELSIVMPCLNEEKSLSHCISKAKDFIKKFNINAEIIIGDNGSIDNSIEIAKNQGAKVIHIKEKGYGAALIGAISAARGKYVVMGDSDASYDFSCLKDFIDKLRGGADVVIGNRFLGGIMPDAMPWKNKYIGNPILTKIGQLFFDINCGDFHCGLRGISKSSFNKLDLNSMGMEFASEMIIRARLKGLKIEEVSTKLYKDGRERRPHLRPWRDGLRHLTLMMIFSPKWSFLYPGLILFLIGLISTLFISFGPVFISNVGFDIGTMLISSTLLCIGVQAVIFFFISKYFGSHFGVFPTSKRFKEFITKFYHFENIMFIALLMISLGLITILFAGYGWSNASFGVMDPRELFRILIPGSVLILIGSQIVIGNLYFKFLMVGKIENKK